MLRTDTTGIAGVALRGLFLAAAAVQLALLGAAGAAGATPSTPDAGAAVANGPVYTIARANGVTYIGGDFTAVGGQPRTGIAALDSGGQLTSWAPNAEWSPGVGASVYTIQVSGNTVYVGGYFAAIGGQSRNSIAAVDATTGQATAWDPNADKNVNDIAVSGTTVYAGGAFRTIGGASRSRIAALDATTGQATAWDPNVSNAPNPAPPVVNAIEISGETVYAGGVFTTIGGAIRSRIAATCAQADCDGEGTAAGSATGWDPTASGSVMALAVSGTTVYAGGMFNTIGGASRSRIAALDATVDTNMATDWNPNASAVVNALAVSGTTVFAGGSFTSIGGASRNYLAALDATQDANMATAWDPDADAAVWAVAASGPTVYAGGEFTAMGASASAYYAQFTDPPVSTVAPEISGTAVVGQTLTCSQGSWSNQPTGYAYQWRRDAADIPGATGSSHTLLSADAGTLVTCRVTATNAGGSAAATSDAVALSPVNAAAPQISGTAVVGETLSCSQGAWQNGPTGYAYQWRRSGTQIAGATNSTYTLVPADEGAAVTCRVTASNAAGQATAISAAVVPAAAPTPEPDTTAPQVTFRSGPPALTNRISAIFEFSAGEADVGFDCRLDGAGWSACGSPEAIYGLALGHHTFEVRAQDRSGNTGPAASWSWTIDRTKPALGHMSVKARARLSRQGFRVLHGVAGTSADDIARVMVKMTIANRRPKPPRGRCAYLSLKTGHRTLQDCDRGFTAVKGKRNWHLTVPAAVRRSLRVSDRYRLLVRLRDAAGNVKVYRIPFRIVD